jgi:cytochrome b
MRAATGTPGLDTGSRLIHLVLVLSGVAAVATGDLADDGRFGFGVHAWIGIAFAVAIGLRVLWGLLGPREMRFSNWVPHNRAQLQPTWDDVLGLLRLRLPQRPLHGGIAGVIQALGLAVFAWMAVTGVPLFFLVEPGVRAAGWVKFVEELHEAGEGLVYAYLALHVGAVVLHALAGDSSWRAMFFLRQRQERR